jgi:hypothetical protein
LRSGKCNRTAAEYSRSPTSRSNYQSRRGLAIVVTLKRSLTPPIESFAVTVVANLSDDRTRTLTVSPLFTLPGKKVKGPPFTEYLPPNIHMRVGALIPVTVMAFDVMKVSRGTSTRSMKVN